MDLVSVEFSFMVFGDGVEIGLSIVGKNGGKDGDGVREIHAEDEAKGDGGEINCFVALECDEGVVRNERSALSRARIVELCDVRC